MLELFNQNRATTTVTSGGTTAPVSGSSETWTVNSSTMFGSAVTNVSQFHVADPALPSELIAVTNVSGTTWTVTRGAESTTPVSHNSGFTVYQVVSAKFMGSPSFSGLLLNESVQTANYNLSNSSDIIVLMNGSTLTATLPTAQLVAGEIHAIKNLNSSTVTVATTSSQTIDGASSLTLSQYQVALLISDGSNWRVIATEGFTKNNILDDGSGNLTTLAAISTSGLTGATAASRYVGATTSGHPTSGTFAVGDFVIDRTGAIWICTTAGSPGSWTQVSGGGGGTFGGGTLTEYLAPAVVALTQSGGSVAVNAALGNVFTLTLTASGWTISNPTNSVDGEEILFRFTEDSTGGRTVNWGTAYDFGVSVPAPPINQGANSVTEILFCYDAAITAWVYGGGYFTGGTLSQYLAPAVVVLADAATVAVNASLGNDFRVTLGGNRTIGAPTSPTDGQDITFLITQPASGGPWTPTFSASGYSYGSGSPPTWSTGANATDMIAFKYRASAGKWLFLGAQTGF